MEEEPEMDIRPAMRTLAMTAMGDFLFFIGAIFLLWGIADFIGGLLGIQGSGFAVVGIALLLIGFVLVMRSRIVVQKAPMPKAEKKVRSEDYR